jgi:hypothetical protein
MAEVWTTEMLAKASELTRIRIRQLLQEDKELHGFKPPGSRDWLVDAEEAQRWLSERGIIVESE